MKQHTTAFAILLLALLAALAALLVHARTAEAPAPVTISIPTASGEQPVLAVFQCRTLHETLYFKLLGNVKNLTAEPVRYVTARCILRDAQGRNRGTAQSLTVPEILLQQEVASFEIVAPFDPAIRGVELHFEEYGSGRIIPVDARQASALFLGGRR